MAHKTMNSQLKIKDSFKSRNLAFQVIGAALILPRNKTPLYGNCGGSGLAIKNQLEFNCGGALLQCREIFN